MAAPAEKSVELAPAPLLAALLGTISRPQNFFSWEEGLCGGVGVAKYGGH